VLLAGAWCATGWPATMEGAVRSGQAAALAALDVAAGAAPHEPVDDATRHTRAAVDRVAP
jgi:hypothetical protein